MAAKLNSYADVQNYFNTIIAQNGNQISSAPHGAFWNKLTYEQFTTGNVPGVSPGVRICVPGDPDNSNIVQALRGVGPLFGPTGEYGQMPADGPPFFTTQQIDELADWIQRGCPN